MSTYTEEILHNLFLGNEDEKIKKLISSMNLQNCRRGVLIIESLFAASVEYGRKTLADYLLSIGAKDYDNALYHSIKNRSKERSFLFEILATAIRLGVCLNRTIYAAAENGDFEIVEELLLNARFSPKAFVYGAAKGGHLKLLRASFIAAKECIDQKMVNTAFLHALQGWVVYRTCSDALRVYRKDITGDSHRDFPRTITYLLRGITNFKEAIELCRTMEMDPSLEEVINAYVKKERVQILPKDMEVSNALRV